MTPLEKEAIEWVRTHSPEYAEHSDDRIIRLCPGQVLAYLAGYQAAKTAACDVAMDVRTSWCKQIECPDRLDEAKQTAGEILERLQTMGEE